MNLPLPYSWVDEKGQTIVVYEARIDPTARGASAAIVAYAMHAFACRRGTGDSLSLIWEIDFVAHPEWRAGLDGYLQRLKAVLHELPCGATPIRIRQWLDIGGARVGVDVLLPIPDVSGDLPRLAGKPPPVGVWRLEVIHRDVLAKHRAGGNAPEFEHDMPY
jgi:hypothetical protein